MGTSRLASDPCFQRRLGLIKNPRLLFPRLGPRSRSEVNFLSEETRAFGGGSVLTREETSEQHVTTGGRKEEEEDEEETNEAAVTCRRSSGHSTNDSSRGWSVRGGPNERF